MADAYDFWAARISSEKTAAIDDFWLRFTDVHRRIERHFQGYSPQVNPDAEMANALGGLATDLACDFEVSELGQITLVVTAELRHTRRALARAAVWRAPELRGWRFSDVRAPVSAADAALKAIRLRSRSDGLAVSSIEPRRGAHRMIDLEVRGAGERDFLADQAGIVFATLLGEDIDQDWLGEVGAEPQSVMTLARGLFSKKADDPAPWLRDFHDEAMAVIAATRDELPDRPYGAHRMRVDDTTNFRLRPTEGDRSRRRDALQYQSRDPKLVSARLGGARVAGQRFSRFAEIPCGLKIRTGTSRLTEAAEIASLGVVLEEALMAARIGGLTGRASGLEHAYIDLALTDIDRGAEVLRRTLAAQDITTPTWLIFDEAGLEDCYHPLMPQTQPTPMDEH
ncbi:MAG: hypothetical protein AAGC57_15250 [Pseudomonadota bacterium]